MKPKEKFIAFVDILGFTNLIEKLETGSGDFSKIFELTESLGSHADTDRFEEHGPTTCPGSKYNSKNLDFKVTQISDCVVISCEISPAGIINLIDHCFGVSLKLLSKGVLCRGVITKGLIYHENGQFFGTGYMRAFKGESQVSFLQSDTAETGTPFIQVEDQVVDYVKSTKDNCILTMFSRATRSDGNYTAIYPFSILSRIPSSIVDRGFDPHYWKQQFQNSISYRMKNLEDFTIAESDAPNDAAKSKIRHYMRGISEAIEILRRREKIIDQMIITGQIPYGSVI